MIDALVMQAIDADTLKVEAHPWPQLNIVTEIRIGGIDTPALNGPCHSERQSAQAALSFIATLNGKRVFLAHVGLDKQGGRYVAKVQMEDGRDLAQTLIDAGLARPSYGAVRRQPWCPPPGSQ